MEPKLTENTLKKPALDKRDTTTIESDSKEKMMS